MRGLDSYSSHGLLTLLSTVFRTVSVALPLCLRALHAASEIYPWRYGRSAIISIATALFIARLQRVVPGLSSNALSSAASDNFLPSFAMAPCVDVPSIPDCFVVQGLSKCDRPLLQ